MERPIIEIDEERCNGCGLCITDCAEGALALVDGKAKLISDVYCDGLGACLNCPRGALKLVIRDAPDFDETAAMRAKLEREQKPLAPKRTPSEITAAAKREGALEKKLKSALLTWPIQLELMPRRANWLENADILLSAQCAGFALPEIGRDWLAGRVPIIACPKLEDNEKLIDRLSGILADNKTGSLTVLRMSVPCCDLERIVREAVARSGKPLEWKTHVARL